jgi:hypothetical protein
MGALYLLVSFLVCLIPVFFMVGSLILLFGLAASTSAFAEKLSQPAKPEDQPACEKDELEAWYARQRRHSHAYRLFEFIRH